MDYSFSRLKTAMPMSFGRRVLVPSLILVTCFFLFFHLWNSNPPKEGCRARFRQVVHSARAAAQQPQNQKQNPSVAICLVGGARAFELTGPSITKHLLNAYENSHLFLHSPLDTDTFKLFLLANSSARFASARIFTPSPIPEQEFHKQLLTASGSPNGLQGLLQYFALVEGCWDMITSYEQQRGISFDWIIRTRLDSFWSGPIAPLTAFSNSHYTVPLGSQFGGLNDRLGIGNRNNSRAALQRLTWLPSGHRHGYRQLNSERAFKAQLQLSNTSVAFQRFPFCIVSTRLYAWPMSGQWGVPVVSLASGGLLNGAKCRPCRSKAVGNEAKMVLDELKRDWGWSGPSEGMELCDASGDWGADWADVFDEVAGNEGKSVRRGIEKLTIDECMTNVMRFEKRWEFWSAPAAEMICKESKIK